MCYTVTLNIGGLNFSISNCFGVGFDWNDQEFIDAVNNKDKRLWKILEWAANGGAERFNQAAEFDERMSLYSDSRDILNQINTILERTGELSALRDNEYLSKRCVQIIEDFYSGELGRKASLEARSKVTTKKASVGYVYLIRAENGLYKIGKAKNVDARLQPFTVHFPMKWELVHSFKSNYYSEAEAQLHQKYADKRDVGEWFRLAPEDVGYILGIKDGQL